MYKRMTSLVASMLMSVSAWSAGNDTFDATEMKEIECTIKPIDRAAIHPRGSAASSQSFSSNWSGYVAASSLENPVNGSVTYAAGCWKVPVLTATPDSSYCAIWVGIDGFTDASVEQIGTSHNWINGAQQNYAWFEMYPNGAYEINGFPVDIHDVMSARVGYKGNGVFKMVLFNHTKGVSFTIPTSYTTSSTALRSCAEWVVEAPYSGSILPLSDFHLTTLNNCSAIINGVFGPINDDLWENDAITMIGNSFGVEAIPSALTNNGNSFSVTWESE